MEELIVVDYVTSSAITSLLARARIASYVNKIDDEEYQVMVDSADRKVAWDLITSRMEEIISLRHRASREMHSSHLGRDSSSALDGLHEPRFGQSLVTARLKSLTFALSIILVPAALLTRYNLELPVYAGLVFAIAMFFAGFWFFMYKTDMR